jgi:protein TonB
MPLRLIIALTLSLVLHGSLLVFEAFRPTTPTPRPVLHAVLRLPPEPARPAEPPPTPEALLKNTIEEEPPRAEMQKPPPPEVKKKTETRSTQPLTRREIRAVQKKLSEYVFYPAQARASGIEGTVVLFVELAANGSVEDVRVVSSSGYPILDNAAIKGFYAIGHLPGASDTWSYTFRLE